MFSSSYSLVEKTRRRFLLFFLRLARLSVWLVYSIVWKLINGSCDSDRVEVCIAVGVPATMITDRFVSRWAIKVLKFFFVIFFYRTQVIPDSAISILSLGQSGKLPRQWKLDTTNHSEMITSHFGEILIYLQGWFTISHSRSLSHFDSQLFYLLAIPSLYSLTYKKMHCDFILVPLLIYYWVKKCDLDVKVFRFFDRCTNLGQLRPVGIVSSKSILFIVYFKNVR